VCPNYLRSKGDTKRFDASGANEEKELSGNTGIVLFRYCFDTRKSAKVWQRRDAQGL
jgi:hypothetical protein